MYKGTNNTHTPYHFQSCSTNTVKMNQICVICQPLSKFLSFQIFSPILPPMIGDHDDKLVVILPYDHIGYKLTLKRFV